MSRLEPHPSTFLTEQTTEQIRSVAAEAEHNRSLHHQQLQAIFVNKWFKLFIPETIGGLGLSLPGALHLEEALAWADGSTGWVVTLCAGAGWFIGFLRPSIAEEFFADSKLCIAGSGDTSGYAEQTHRGYVINGAWRYASGSLQATAFTANCQLTKHNEPLLREDGSPEIVTVLFSRKEVTVRQTWDMMGMMATGSHSFEVKDLTLGADRLFRIDPKQAVLPDLVYRYPFLQLAETTLAVNLSGMAMRFVELAGEVINRNLNRKSNEEPPRILERCLVELEASRLTFYEVVLTSWEQLRANQLIDDGVLQNTSIASQALARVARNTVNELYPFCGLPAARQSSELNRIWRNLHTAGQHILFR